VYFQPSRNCSGPSTLNPGVLCSWASGMDGIPWWYEYSINPIKVLSQDFTIHPPLDDRQPHRSTQARNVPSWPCPYIQYWHTCTVRLVSSVHIIPCHTQRTHASCIRTHLPSPYVIVLSWSCTPGTMGHRLWPNDLDTIGSL
jgi:hypothetical protein